MSGGGRCPRRQRWSRRRWIRRRHEGGAKICDDDDGVQCVVKPADIGIQNHGEDSICVRDRCIGRSRLRINAEGILYVLDSEDEDSDMEVDADGIGVAAEGAATANGVDVSVERPAVADDGAASADLSLGPPLASAGAAGEDLPLGPSLAAPDDASGMDLAPEVAARLKEVLANMDPIYHEVFISMYKILIKFMWTVKVETCSLWMLFLYSNYCNKMESRERITFMMFVFSLRSSNIKINDMRTKAFIVMKMLGLTLEMGFIFKKLIFLESDFIFLLIHRVFIEIRQGLSMRIWKRV